MENTEIIINASNPKKPISEAQKKAHKKYIQKIKDNEEHKEYKRQNAKRYYENNKEHVIDRVKQYQQNKTSMLQLERLYILKNQGLITFDDSMTKEGLIVLLDNLKILGA
jgi:CMP-N-acetylneuraminic acid synthetase